MTTAPQGLTPLTMLFVKRDDVTFVVILTEADGTSTFDVSVGGLPGAENRRFEEFPPALHYALEVAGWDTVVVKAIVDSAPRVPPGGPWPI
jgi:hypothetical protein